ncbi:MAG: hypothetical protein KIT69_07025 [Propionibacteriaceae bacterium]|nr:hypothetical protein [Propionibacteriaceae bacterium]
MSIILDILYKNQSFSLFDIKKYNKTNKTFFKYITIIDNNWYKPDKIHHYKYIKKFPKLKELNLDDALPKKGICYLINTFFYIKRLKILYLGSNYLTDDSVRLLMINIKYLSQLTVLDLQDNSLTDKSIKLLCKKNFKHLNKLKTLNLQFNEITDKSLDYLFKNIFNSNIIDIDLTSNNLIFEDEDTKLNNNNMIDNIEKYIKLYIIPNAKLKYFILISSFINLINIDNKKIDNIYNKYNILLYNY